MYKVKSIIMVFAERQFPRPLTLQESVSMTTYSSDKAVPYVYICTHKETKQFYIGYREKNVRLNRPSHLDLPKYKTSSTTIRPDWSNYTWTIVAEFFDPSHAYTFEQQMICDNWENPLLLNGQYRLGKIKQFRNSGPSPRKGIPTGPNGRKGIPTGPQGPRGPNGKKGIPNGRKGIPNGRKGTPSPNKGKPNGRKGIPSPKKGIPTGKPSWNKGIPSKKKGIPSGQIPWNKGISTGPSPRKGMPYGKQRNPAPKVKCPHCGLVGDPGNMTRHHFDNCKKKP